MARQGGRHLQRRGPCLPAPRPVAVDQDVDHDAARRHARHLEHAGRLPRGVAQILRQVVDEGHAVRGALLACCRIVEAKLDHDIEGLGAGRRADKRGPRL